MMKGSIDNTRLNTGRNVGVEDCITHTALDTDPISMIDAALFSVMRMNLKSIFRMPLTIASAPSLSANIILRENSTGR
jgi:hypothetical protein